MPAARFRRVLRGLAAALALCWSLATFPARVAAEDAAGIAWEKSFSAALKQARRTGKPVMAGFRADWCPWCRKLDTVTYADPRVIELSRAFVGVQVDIEGGLEEREVSYEYGFVQLPTIAFFSPQGRLLMALKRYQGPDEFPDTLRVALETAARVERWERALKAKDEDARAEGLACLGAHLFALERREESHKLLERATRLDRGRPVAERKTSRLLLGRIRLDQRKESDAEGLAREALALQPASPPEDALALVLLGNAQQLDGRFEAARASWELALETDPDGIAADDARRFLRTEPPSR
jgi:tetratricopeptide (TPR) repeat protein